MIFPYLSKTGRSTVHRGWRRWSRRCHGWRWGGGWWRWWRHDHLLDIAGDDRGHRPVCLGRRQPLLGLVVAEHFGLELLAGAGQVGLQVFLLLYTFPSYVQSLAKLCVEIPCIITYEKVIKNMKT